MTQSPSPRPTGTWGTGPAVCAYLHCPQAWKGERTSLLSSPRCGSAAWHTLTRASIGGTIEATKSRLFSRPTPRDTVAPPGSDGLPAMGGTSRPVLAPGPDTRADMANATCSADRVSSFESKVSQGQSREPFGRSCHPVDRSSRGPAHHTHSGFLVSIHRQEG